MPSLPPSGLAVGAGFSRRSFDGPSRRPGFRVPNSHRVGGSHPSRAESAAMLPRREFDTLLLTMTDVVDLADNGDAAEGYTALLAGLHRAKELRDEGFEWGEELVRRWEMACDLYAERHGIGRA